MKKFFTLLVLMVLFFSVRTFAQDLVVTEIMYNDPSTGATGDSLEFIEIYNNTADPMDITGYQITGTVTFTFPSFTLQPYAYQIVARNSAASQNYYGLSGVYQWTTGQSLANNGGNVVVKDAAGITLDSVPYSPNAPWPASAAGNGSSIMLCDPMANNLIGSNWVGAGLLNANTYGLTNGAAVYATPGTACNTVTPYVPVFAVIPYNQGFNADWLNGDGLRNAPDHSWKINPALGNTSFRRDDDGHAGAGWNTVTGAYTPAGANTTAHSARFHSSGTQLSGEADLYLDFNTTGIKKLKFWYINASGNDSLSLFISYDNGTSFTYLTKYVNATSWTQELLDLGSSLSSTVILRFKASGTAAAGGSDIGLDEVEVFLAPANDAGIAAITNPVSAMSALTNNVEVTLTNFGSADLTAVDINWEVNGVIQPVLPWTGSLTQGSSALNVVLGSFTFPATGPSAIKAWTSMPNATADGDNSNDTASKSVYYQPYAAIPYDEGFDSVWVNKLDSNDVPSAYWHNEPFTGNASWRRSDDGASANWTNPNNGIYNPTGASGTTFSARFHSATAANGSTGTLLLFVDFSLAGHKELTFNYMNTSGNDSLAVWISYDGGNTYAFLQKFINANNWAPQVIQLSNSTSPTVVVRFRATRNGGGGPATDIGLDQVHIGLTPPDAGILSVVNPVSGCGLSDAEAVTIKVKNYGYIPISNIPVSYIFNGNTTQETITSTLQPGDTATYTFTTTVDLSASGTSAMSFYTAYPADVNHLNDTLHRNISNINVINTFPFLEDFETGNTAFLALTGAANAAVSVDTAIGINNSHGLRMTGGAVPGTWPAGSGNTTTPAQAWSYTDHHGTAATCMVNATSLNSPQLKIDLRQIHITNGGPRYSYFRVVINDTIPVASEGGVTDFNPLTPTADPYQSLVFDLHAFANTQFKVSLQSACKYAPGGAYALGDDAFVDNFIIDEKPPQEVGIIAVTSPTSGCNLGTAEHITISVKNNGSAAAVNFPVGIKVDNGSWVNETSTMNILPDSIGFYTFNATFDLSAAGPHNIVVVTQLSGDPVLTNDTLKTNISVVPYISSFPYFQDFEGAFTGWTSGSIAGQDIWALGTPTKTNLNYAFSGNNTYTTDLTANYQNNANIYVASPCYNFTNLVHPYLSVYLNFFTQNNFDAMILEASVNDSAWYKIPVDTLFYNNYSAQLPVAPPKWSGNSAGFQKYATGLQSLAGKAKVQFRFRFQTNANTVSEGFSIDDFTIKEATADAQCLTWVSPTTACSFTNAEPVTVRFMNSGELPLTDLPVAYSINNGVNFIYDTIHQTIMPSEIVNYTFIWTANLSSGAPFHCVAKAILSDPTPANNIINYTLATLPTITGVPFTDDFESTTNYFSLSNGADAAVAVLPTVGLGGSAGIQFTGLAAGTWPGGSSQTTTAAQAFGYTEHVSSATTCDITVTGVNSLWLKLALRQTHSTGPRYSFFRVMLNGTEQLTDTSGVTDYNPVTQAADPFTWRLFDITSHIGTAFKITLEASCKYDDANATGNFGDKAQVDSVQLLESITVGTHELDNNPYLISYPNPAKNSLRVEFGKTVQNGEISLIDALGKVVMLSAVVNTQGMTINMENLSPGIYCLRFKSNKNVLTQRIIKE